jgi:hypothetical protein
MKTESRSATDSTIAATVAPEDLTCGQYIAVLNEIIEIPACCWLDLPLHPPEMPVRVRVMSLDAGVPLKVQAVCLPFVYVRHPDGCLEPLDTRRLQLVRLSRCYARTVLKAVRKRRERQTRRCATGAP